jgi:hypothetical protein
MVQVDLPAAFAVGQVFAFLSKNYLKKEPNLFKNKLTGPLNLYLSCGFSLAGMFLLIGWPSWEVMFTTNWVEDPFNRPLVAGFYILFLVFMILLGNLGFILGHLWYRKGKDKWVIYGSVIGIFLTFLPFLLKWGVWFKIGTYAEIKSGGGTGFFDPPFFYGWLVIMGYFVLSTVLTGMWFKKTADKEN